MDNIRLYTWRGHFSVKWNKLIKRVIFCSGQSAEFLPSSISCLIVTLICLKNHIIIYKILINILSFFISNLSLAPLSLCYEETWKRKKKVKLFSVLCFAFLASLVSWWVLSGYINWFIIHQYQLFLNCMGHIQWERSSCTMKVPLYVIYKVSTASKDSSEKPF